MPKFRKKPVVVEAEQFDGEAVPDILTHECSLRDELGYVCLKGMAPSIHPERSRNDGNPYITIFTLEGEMMATVGDWIIEGVNGEFYPCKPDIFEKTYEPVDE